MKSKNLSENILRSVKSKGFKYIDLPSVIEVNHIVQRSGENFRKFIFSFIDQNGNTVTETTVKNKIYVVDFFFTSCPSICIDLTNNLKEVQSTFIDNNDVLILSHSVDPKIDNIERLKKYATINNISNKKWFLLTGPIEETIRMAQLGYFAIASVPNHGENSLIHTENVILIDKNRKIRGIYNGTSPLETSYLIDDIKKLLYY